MQVIRKLSTFSKPGKAAFPVITLILLLCASNIKWGENAWKSNISNDSYGYYVYLPAVIIYQDLYFRFVDGIESKYREPDRANVLDPHPEVKAASQNKFFCGTAVAILPFFLIAHLTAALTGADTDGFSKLYLVFVNIAAIFYLLTGLTFLLKFLIPVGLNEFQKALLLFAAVFGTNVFYYVINEPAMSHIYSFAFITAFLYYGQQYFRHFKTGQVYILAALLGITTLIRPINGLVVLLLPFLAGNYPALKKGFLNFIKSPSAIIIAFLIFGAFLIPQLLIYKATFGRYWLYSYATESFNFLDPHFVDILFSYKKGLFLYTPLFFISLIGGWFLFRQSVFNLLTLFGFLVFLTYILSSWWCWYYGGSFSGRPYLEFTALFMYLLALALKGIRNAVAYRSFNALIIILILICQFQTYQYRKAYIHWSEMNKEKYWDVFLNPDKLLVSSKNKTGR